MANKFQPQAPAGEIAVINEYGSLQQFYTLTEKLARNKKVKFTGKQDDAYNIDWTFTYRGRPLILQYNIYNGLALLARDRKGTHELNELAGSLR